MPELTILLNEFRIDWPQIRRLVLKADSRIHGK